MEREVLLAVIYEQQHITLPDNFVSRTNTSLTVDNQIIVLSGVRRCGKSTLLQEIRSKSIENKYYLNFDDDRLIHFKVDDFQFLYELFIEIFGVQSNFFFDDIQNIPGWERFIRRLHDNGKKVFVTGSNASMLSRELGTHLTGRFYQFELFPFSFKEVLFFKGKTFQKEEVYTTLGKAAMKQYFMEYFKKGGFPAYLRFESTP
ncbi:MAG TPA: AAA family ATPase, partial [Bacteroidales bacterium]|nr:AAA family ATPase [Bacteroidales bacterium]